MVCLTIWTQKDMLGNAGSLLGDGIGDVIFEGRCVVRGTISWFAVVTLLEMRRGS